MDIASGAVNAWTRLETVNVSEPVDLEVVSSSSEVVRDPAGYRTRSKITATHDLDVAAQVDARFASGYFCEPDDASGQFDRKLRPDVSPASNALALLIRAGYPARSPTPPSAAPGSYITSRSQR